MVQKNGRRFITYCIEEISLDVAAFLVSSANVLYCRNAVQVVLSEVNSVFVQRSWCCYLHVYICFQLYARVSRILKFDSVSDTSI